VKVCFLTPEYPPLPCGGIGSTFEARALALVRAGHEVHVVGPGPHTDVVAGGVPISFDPVRHPPKTGWLLTPHVLRARVGRLVQAHGIDVVVAPDWLGLSAAGRPGCPVIVDCNGSATYFADELDLPVRATVRRAERRAARRADRVTAVSRHVALRTQNLFGLAVEPDVVHNGVDLAAFAEHAPEDRDPHRIVMVGTLVRKKGVLDAADAFGRILAGHPQARLQIIGRDAPDQATGAPSTRDLVTERLGGAAASTEWAGHRPHRTLPDLLNRGSVLLAPSYAEAQPLAWLEAMATGMPVVAYDLPWAREVVESGTHGLLVPRGDIGALADATLQLLSDPARRAAMGKAAAARARDRFGADRCAADALAVFQEVVAGASRRTGVAA
jgi:glycosyltransferase involved in cell wall biosynthesis